MHGFLSFAFEKDWHAETEACLKWKLLPLPVFLKLKRTVAVAWLWEHTHTPIHHPVQLQNNTNNVQTFPWWSKEHMRTAWKHNWKWYIALYSMSMYVLTHHHKQDYGLTHVRWNNKHVSPETDQMGKCYTYTVCVNERRAEHWRLGFAERYSSKTNYSHYA